MSEGKLKSLLETVCLQDFRNNLTTEYIQIKERLCTHYKLGSIYFIEKDTRTILKDNTAPRKTNWQALWICNWDMSSQIQHGNMAPYPTAWVSRSLAQAFVFVFRLYSAKKAWKNNSKVFVWGHEKIIHAVSMELWYNTKKSCNLWRLLRDSILK